jgi:hypothetical protein
MRSRTPGGVPSTQYPSFGIAGLLSAFALSGSRQHELQFYRELANASGEVVSGKIDTLLFVLASRLEGSLSAKQQEQLARAALDLHELVTDGVPGVAGVHRRRSYRPYRARVVDAELGGGRPARGTPRDC